MTTLVHSWDVARHHIALNGGLVNRRGLMKLWGVSRTRVTQYTDPKQTPDFPAPLSSDTEAVWLVDEVQHWKRQREEQYG